MSGYALNTVFQQELLEGEEILWAGQPNPHKHFNTQDLFLIPMSLFVFGFAIFWETMALRTITGRGGSPNGPVIFFPLFGLPLVIVGFYLLIGRFFLKRWKKFHTFYAVTNKRVLILTTSWTKHNVQALSIKNLPAISESVNAAGYGTVRFGSASSMGVMGENSGVEWFFNYQRPSVPSFYDIADAHRVYQLVNEIQNRKEGEAKGWR